MIDFQSAGRQNRVPERFHRMIREGPRVIREGPRMTRERPRTTRGRPQTTRGSYKIIRGCHRETWGRRKRFQRCRKISRRRWRIAGREQSVLESARPLALWVRRGIWPNPVRGGIFVASPAIRFFSSVRSGIKTDVAPDGAFDLCGLNSTKMPRLRRWEIQCGRSRGDETQIEEEKLETPHVVAYKTSRHAEIGSTTGPAGNTVRRNEPADPN